MPIVDAIIIFVTVGMAVRGYRQGVRIKLLLAVAFGVGALFGSHVGPLILDGGLHDPFAPAVALPAALLFGALFAAAMERAGLQLQWTLRRRYTLDAIAGAALMGFLGVVLVWSIAAASARVESLEGAVESSGIVSGLNSVMPPPGPVLTANETPLPPEPGRRARGFADVRIKQDPEVKAAARSVVKITVTKCAGPGEASGWIAGDGLVMTNAHVVEGSRTLGVKVEGAGRPLDAEAIFYDVNGDVSVLRVPDLHPELGLRIHPRPEVASSVAVLGFPFGRRYKARAGVLGPTIRLRGPLGARRRSTTLLRAGLGLGPGVSGGPVVDRGGRVVAMIFGGSPILRRRFAYGVPSTVMRRALRTALASPREVDTGTCTDDV